MHTAIYGGCDLTDKKGEHIEELLFINNLSLFNTKSIPYIHPGTGKQTSLDLTITNPTMFLDWTWEVHSDQCGSDHFPVILNSNTPQSPDNVQRWLKGDSNKLTGCHSTPFANQNYHRLTSQILKTKWKCLLPLFIVLQIGRSPKHQQTQKDTKVMV